MPAPTREHWTRHGANVFEGKDCIGIFDTNNAPQAVMEARAERCVRAVAAHAALVAALRGVVHTLDVHGHIDSTTDLHEQARAALKAAGEEG